MRPVSKSVYLYTIIGFIIGFIGSLASLTFDEIRHGFFWKNVLGDFHHYVSPFIIGIIVSFFGYAIAIKNIKNQKANDALSTEQIRYLTMISNISDVIAIVRADGLVGYKSPNIKLHFGWDPEDLIGKDAWHTVHPDDLERIQKEFVSILQKDNQKAEVEYRYKCKDGSYKMINLKAINLLNNPYIEGLLLNYHDISEQKKAEDELKESEFKYRALFENMIDVVCILDNQGNFKEINKAGVSLYEYSKEELINMNISQLIHPEDKTISDKYLENLKKEGFYENYEGRIITKTGKIKWIQVSSTKMTYQGTELGSQDIIRDITEKKETELSLLNKTMQLHELNTAKDKFFSIIAHDLKGPLSSILNFSGLMIERIKNYNPEKVENMVHEFHSRIENTYNYLINLLDWAVSQRGNMPYNPENLNLKYLIQEQLEVLHNAAQQKNISINIYIGDDITVFADKNMLISVIHNLIMNSVKFTNNGGLIECSANKINNEIEIAVKDNGIGIAQDVKSDLFKLGSTKSTKGTENEKGTGLGLILCKEFVEKHGGKIWVESKLNQGSVFKFTMPEIAH